MGNGHYDNVWNEFRDGTFEDIILSKAVKLKKSKKKEEKLDALDELVNYAKRYSERLITGK